MPSAAEVLQQIDTMEKKIAQLERVVQQQNGVIRELLDRKPDIPNHGLMADSFLLRAFTVWGHYFVAQLIIAAVLSILFFCATYNRLF